MNKKYIAIAIVLIVIIFFFFRNKNTENMPPAEPVSISESIGLTTDWITVSETDTDVKLEKTVTEGLKPQIVFKKTSSKDAVTPAKYVDNLKAGARSTLTGLVYQTDKRDPGDSAYTAFLTGYYLNKGKKVFIDQRLYIQGEDVYTFSGSSDESSVADVSQAIDKLYQEKIAQ